MKQHLGNDLGVRTLTTRKRKTRSNGSPRPCTAPGVTAPLVLSVYFTLGAQGCAPATNVQPSAPGPSPRVAASATSAPQKVLSPAPLAPIAAVHRTPKTLSDAEIVDAVDYTLLTDAALHDSAIDVSASAGVVTLTGSVDNLMAKERAAALAETIRSVRAVVNTISLKPIPRTDGELTKDVEAALLYDAATDAYPVKPVAKDGVVALTGTVGSFNEKQLVILVVKGVKGVREVKDKIAIDTAKKRPDGEIAAEVKQAIATDVWLHPNFITTEVHDGVVTLGGKVGSPTDLQRAVHLAWTSGVSSVHFEGLQVDPTDQSMGQRRVNVPVQSDVQIGQAVHAALLYDPRVSSFNVRADVANGVVTLAGQVDNLKARRAAEQDAKDTWGVLRTNNLLKVRPIKWIPDTRLEQNVLAAIARDPVVKDFDIHVKARNGNIAISGTVATNYESALADDIASRGNGVVDVTNNIEVSAPNLWYHDTGYNPYWTYLPSGTSFPAYHPGKYNPRPAIADPALKDDIESRILWSPWLDNDEIVVSVANGAVTLSGLADSRFEIEKASKYAYEAGALDVINVIRLR